MPSKKPIAKTSAPDADAFAGLATTAAPHRGVETVSQKEAREQKERSVAALSARAQERDAAVQRASSEAREQLTKLSDRIASLGANGPDFRARWTELDGQLTVTITARNIELTRQRNDDTRHAAMPADKVRDAEVVSERERCDRNFRSTIDVIGTRARDWLQELDHFIRLRDDEHVRLAREATEKERVERARLAAGSTTQEVERLRLVGVAAETERGRDAERTRLTLQSAALERAMANLRPSADDLAMQALLAGLPPPPLSDEQRQMERQRAEAAALDAYYARMRAQGLMGPTERFDAGHQQQVGHNHGQQDLSARLLRQEQLIMALIAKTPPVPSAGVADPLANALQGMSDPHQKRLDLCQRSLSALCGTRGSMSTKGSLYEFLKSAEKFEVMRTEARELRQQFVQAARGNSDAETLADLFLSTPQGQTPAALIGDTPTHVLARNAAWWWLKKLAAIVMAAVLRNTSDADRAACPKDLLPFLEDDIERLNATLLSRALSRTPGSANASDAPSKRARESAGSQQAKRPSRTLPVGARRQVTAVRPQQRQQMPTPPAPTLPLPTTPGAPGAIICRRCGGRGHIERDCPSKR